PSVMVPSTSMSRTLIALARLANAAGILDLDWRRLGKAAPSSEGIIGQTAGGREKTFKPHAETEMNLGARIAGGYGAWRWMALRRRKSIKSRTLWSRALRLNGFWRNAEGFSSVFSPPPRARSSSYPDTNRTFNVGLISAKEEASWRPFMPGMTMSVTNRSMGCEKCLARSKA